MAEITAATLPGVHVVTPPPLSDERGSFTKLMTVSDFRAHGLRTDFQQIFYTRSVRNVIRGMHLQVAPHDHAKLVCCVSGSILDLAVDLRPGPTFGRYEEFRLEGSRPQALYLPPGLAHGFLVLSEEAVTLYAVTSEYVPASDTGIRWDSFGYAWPIAAPIVSARDAKLPTLAELAAKRGAPT